MSAKAHTIAYVRCSSTTGRNAAFPIHVLLGISNWPGRVLDQRGLGGIIRHRRPADAIESEGITNSERALEYKYQTLTGLIEDELRCGTSVADCQAIIDGFYDMPASDRAAAQSLLPVARKEAA